MKFQQVMAFFLTGATALSISTTALAADLPDNVDTTVSATQTADEQENNLYTRNDKDLTDAEFVLFTDQVAGELEGTYPVYATFVEMPGVTDTVDMVVVTTIVDELNADARNMRHIFPYNYLVAQGVLPAGLDHEQQKAFYNCFAAKVNATYATMDQFFNAILADTSDMSQIRRLESQCANDLFSWVVTEVDVIETVPATPAATAQTPAAPKTTAGQQTPAAPAKK